MVYKIQWTERKKEEDRDTGLGMGPRFHPMFSNAKVVKETDRTITFERIVLDSETVACQVHQLKSWEANFDIKTEKVVKNDKKEDEKEKLKVGCPICLQEVDTYIDDGFTKIENHDYRDSRLQCPGSGDVI